MQKSEIGSSRGGLRPYPLMFHVGEAGADAKLIQHGPLGVDYHRRHPISTILVAVDYSTRHGARLKNNDFDLVRIFFKYFQYKFDIFPVACKAKVFNTCFFT